LLTSRAASIVRDTLFLLISSGHFVMAKLLSRWWRHHVFILSCHTHRVDDPFALRTRTLLLSQKQTVVPLLMRKLFRHRSCTHLTFPIVAITLRRSVSRRIPRLLPWRHVLQSDLCNGQFRAVLLSLCSLLEQSGSVQFEHFKIVRLFHLPTRNMARFTVYQTLLRHQKRLSTLGKSPYHV